eukprot:SAG31_NODE_2395_length_5790_cov_73.555614_6_plen_114_part_00
MGISNPVRNVPLLMLCLELNQIGVSDCDVLMSVHSCVAADVYLLLYRRQVTPVSDRAAGITTEQNTRTPTKDDNAATVTWGTCSASSIRAINSATRSAPMDTDIERKQQNIPR